MRPDTVMLTSSSIIAVTPAPPPTPQPPTPLAAKSDAAGDTGAATTAEDPLLGRIIDGRYRIRGRIGSGGAGVVYEGEHIEIKKRVALKVLHAVLGRSEEFRKRFEREAQAASRLSHPACVSVLDFGRIAKVEPAAGSDPLIATPYLVMEFVSGDLLADRIDKGKLPPHEAVMIARGALSALRHAHGLGIVHRDVKPANIMLAKAGETAPLVKLLDFGLAKNIIQNAGDVPLTQAGIVFGTPAYLSPEQAAGAQADARSDLYALGIVLFEMVCGSPPFARGDRVDMIQDHLLRPPPRPTTLTPSLSSELEAVILKALEKEPKERFQTADEFQAALGAVLESSSAAVAQSAPTSPRPRVPFKIALPSFDQLLDLARGRVSIAVAGALALILVVGLLAGLLHASSPDPLKMVSPPAVAAQPASPVTASGMRHFSLAVDYQRKLWCSDAIDELERTLRDEPQVRANPEITRTAIPCLRAKTQAKAVRFLVDSVGVDAKPELEAALAVESKTDVREGIERTLARLTGRL
jgi:serine/threonine-protein kinase